MSNDAPKTTHYELPQGAIAILREILPSPTWYKEDPKQGVLIARSVGAYEALPEIDRPVSEKEESARDFEKRAKAWAETVLEFEWTEKQKDAVKICVRHYLKQGAFTVTKHTVAMLRLLGLDEE
jgi:hypothetical protein